MKNTKQVIILRRFSNLRIGKYASQAAHASMAFLTKFGKMKYDIEYGHNDYVEYFFRNGSPDMRFHFEVINHWLENSFRKIVCYVDSEEELRELHQKALDKGLMAHLIEDNGATEFGGVKTLTALAIGPAWEEDFEGVTDKLRLL